MSGPSHRAAADFRPELASFRIDPYPVYARLQAESPVVFRPDHNDWIITGYRDVRALLLEPALRGGAAQAPDAGSGGPEPDAEAADHGASREAAGESAAIAGRSGSDGTAEVRRLNRYLRRANSGMLLNLSTEPHARVKAALRTLFAGEELAALRPRVQALAQELVARRLAAGRIDVVKDLAVPLAFGVASDLVGIPEPDNERVRGWVRDFGWSIDLATAGSRRVRLRGQMALLALHGYTRQLLTERRGRARADLIGRMLELEAPGGELSFAEIHANATLLLLAGYENCQNMIALATYLLLTHPDQLALLQSRPGLIDTAVEEFFRFGSPVQCTSHVARRSIALGEHLIGEGTLVHTVIAAANRDPAPFEKPDRFDVGRQPNSHLTFGAGGHYCLGFGLARLEIGAAIGALVAMLADMRLAEPEPEWLELYNMRGFKRLDVAFLPRG